MKAPGNLSHKPIVEVADYDVYDGIYANRSDAKALSLGLAQWNADELSVKVWRMNRDTGWSRQSEELPLHRALDLAYLVATVYDDICSHAVGNYEAGRIRPSYTDFTIRVTGANGKANMSGNQHADADAHELAGALECMEAYFQKHGEVIRRRLKVLKDKLNAMSGI